MDSLTSFQNLTVTKRSGKKEQLNEDNIRKQTKLACEGLNVKEEDLIEAAKINFYNGISTREIQELLIKTAERLIDVDKPDYTYVAARLKLYDLYHSIKHLYNVPGSGDVYEKVKLSDYFDHYGYTLDDFYKTYSKEEIEELNACIDSSKDLLFGITAVYVLMKQYLNRVSKDKVNRRIKGKNKIVELPQHMLMTIAMYNCQNEKKENRIEIIKKQYHYLSNQYIIPASPQLSNGRIKNGSIASCFVTSADDNIVSISNRFQALMYGSKAGAGYGIDISRIRSLGAPIGENANGSKGKVRVCRVLDALSIYIDQGGKRPGAYAVTINIWDLDLEQFLDLKKQQGDPEMRAHNIYPAVNVDDVYMTRLKKSIYDDSDETYTLFDPYDVRDLCDLYGKEFEERYLWHEKNFLEHPEEYNSNTKSVDVKQIARWLVMMLTESGFPYWTFIDTINNNNPYPELGKIRTGNLCQEVMLPANENEIAVCNLGSLNLARINGDMQLLEDATRVLARFLDNSIDITSYPHPDCYNTQSRQRANGLGVLGEAEYIAKKQIHFGSKEHLEEIDKIYGLVDRVTKEVSQELAEEKGSCVIPGVRNAYRLCIAPNTTTGLYASTTSGCEPVYKRSWVENKGNIPNVTMTAPHIDINNYEYYQSAFEIDQRALIDATARRQKYIDMSISFSLFFDANKKNGLDLLKDYIYAWEAGIKSLYYLRNVKMDEEIETTEITCTGCAN